MLIDTHKAIEKMIAAGNTKENAEVIVEIINSQNDNVATKGDIKILKTQVDSVKTELNSVKTELNSKIDSVRSEIGTIKWMLGLLGALNLMILSIILAGKF